MAQPVSIEFHRRQTAYWNAEAVLAVSQYRAGLVPQRYAISQSVPVTNCLLNREPFSHRFTGQKVYSHE